MDEKLTLLLEQLSQINARLITIDAKLAPLAERVDKFVLDLSEFKERFEELEEERRADRWADR